MSKRKRDAEEAVSGTARDTRQQRRIQHAFNQSAQQLAQAFKLAKGFERQKLGRRKKDAGKEQDYRAVRRINAEIVAVKSLDAKVGAKQYLAKSLLKIKAAAVHPDLLEEIRDAAGASTPATVEGVDDDSRLNVMARICNSNPVRKTLPAALKEVKTELGLEDHGKDEYVMKKRSRAKDYEGIETKDSGSEEVRHEKKNVAPTVIPEQGSGAQHYDDDDDDDEEEMEQYDSRLAFSDDEEGSTEQHEAELTATDNEDDDVKNLERQLEFEGISRRQNMPSKSKYDLAAEPSPSEIETDRASTSPEPRKETAFPQKSSFLPALTLGGYISGSGSDIEDIDVAPPRKNRRGQRARQQIWEQKYGASAKHLQRQDRNKGWDSKRAAANDRVSALKGGRGTPGSNASSRKQAGKNANGTARVANKTRRDDTGTLHPSWEAAKRAKERKNAPIAFQGKKISFD